MELTRENLAALYYCLNASFSKGLVQAWSGWLRFCMVIQSTICMEKFPIYFLTGAMHEWIGERVINEPSGKMLDVINKDYEHTECIRRNDIKNEMIGLYSTRGIEAANLLACIIAACPR